MLSSEVSEFCNYYNRENNFLKKWYTILEFELGQN
jgi:hypothetical protein